jgi:hypothetical protein
MSDLTTGLIIGGVIVFFLQWAGRHILDRLVLPRFLDRWAKLSKTMARNRGRFLLTQFEDNLRIYSNIHLFVLRLEDRRTKLFAFLFAITILVVLAILSFLYTPGDQATPHQVAFLVFAVIVMCASSVFTFVIETRRDYKTFSDFGAYRARTIARLEKLLQAAGLNESAIRERIEAVPAVP